MNKKQSKQNKTTRTSTPAPEKDEQRRAAFNAALEKVNRKYGNALKKLAE